MHKLEENALLFVMGRPRRFGLRLSRRAGVALAIRHQPKGTEKGGQFQPKDGSGGGGALADAIKNRGKYTSNASSVSAQKAGLPMREQRDVLRSLGIGARDAGYAAAHELTESQAEAEKTLEAKGFTHVAGHTPDAKAGGSTPRAFWENEAKGHGVLLNTSYGHGKKAITAVTVYDLNKYSVKNK